MIKFLFSWVVINDFVIMLFRFLKFGCFIWGGNVFSDLVVCCMVDVIDGWIDVIDRYFIGLSFD